MPFVFTSLAEKEKFVKDLQARSLTCETFISHIFGQDNKSQPGFGLPFNPLRHTFSFSSDVWIPTVALSVNMQTNDPGFSGVASWARQMLALSFTPDPLPTGIDSSVSNDQANEIASILTGWTSILSQIPANQQDGGTDGFGTTVFSLKPNGFYVPANKPIYLYFYNLMSDVLQSPTFLIKSALYYIPIPG